MKEVESIKYKTYDNRLLFNLEWGIIKEKISQGLNGIEWLVMSIKTEQYTIDNHRIWFKRIGFKGMDAYQAVIDNFLLNPDDFHDKYELNWWISFKHSIYQLQLLKEHDYNEYFNLLQQYQAAN